MTSTMNVRRPPPPPPGGARDSDYASEAGTLPVPLTRDNITLLQALSQPSRLRRRVAPNFEAMSWDDPDHMQYSLNGYRPPQSEDGARGAGRKDVRPPPPAPRNATRLAEREAAKGAAERGLRHEDDDNAYEQQHNGANKPRGGRAPTHDTATAPPTSSLHGDEAQRGTAQRHHPQRPPAPLPSQRPQQLTSAGSEPRQPYPHQQREPTDDDDQDYEEADYGASGSGQQRQDVPRHTGRLNMRVFEDQYNGADGDHYHPHHVRPIGSAADGTTRREDLPMHAIYASRDSDDASYRKRPIEQPQPRRQPVREEEEDGEYEYADEDDHQQENSESSRFGEAAENSANVRSGRPEKARSGNAYNSEDDDDHHNSDYVDDAEGYENGSDRSDRRNYRQQQPLRPLRDTWEKPRSDNSDRDNASGQALPCRGAPRPAYEDSVDGGAALCGEVLSCDDYEVMQVPAQHRPPRQQQPQQPRRQQPPPPQPARQRRPQPPPAPPAAPVRGAAYPKAPQAYATRQETTFTTKKTQSRHNPKAFKNKTTHSWISTNTTTTVILPAATVQLVPLSGPFAPVVEEVGAEEGRWATPSYLLQAPPPPPPPAPAGAAGYYVHRPSQMTVLEDSDDATDGRGRVATSLPQLPRRAYESANNYNGLHDSMPEL